MLGRRLRLTDARIFQSLFQRGTWIKGSHISLRLMPAKQHGQVAFVVSKKITKQAHERNSMKRRLRALIRDVSQDSLAQPLLDRHYVLVVVHRNFLDVAYTELRNELMGMFQKVQPKGSV